jgi:Rieske Fe-S protein
MANPELRRRNFLGFLTMGLLVVIGLCLAVPAAGYVWAPLRRRRRGNKTEAEFVEVGTLAGLPIGQWRLLTVDAVREDGWEKTRVRRAIWVRRPTDSDAAVLVLSPICPHLGCPVNWHLEQSEFRCPCHGGVFNGKGQVLAGPPPRGLDPLAYETRDGKLWVRWEDFKIGVADRLSVDM